MSHPDGANLQKRSFDCSDWTFTCLDNFHGGVQCIGQGPHERSVTALGATEEIARIRCKAAVLRSIESDAER